MIQALRDEAHRFGITHHRLRRSKTQISSSLDSIKGIGPATAQTLMRRFRSLKRLREASLDDIAKEIGPAKARLVRAHFLEEARRAPSLPQNDRPLLAEARRKGARKGIFLCR